MKLLEWTVIQYDCCPYTGTMLLTTLKCGECHTKVKAAIRAILPQGPQRLPATHRKLGARHQIFLMAVEGTNDANT